MQIVGNGMIARAFEGLRDELPDVLLFASGVSWSSATADAGFRREADLLYESVRKVRADGRRIVYFSTASSHLYGRAATTGEEDGPIYPCTAYGRHKAVMESVIRASGAAHLILRLTEVAGPNQPAHQLLPSLAAQVAAGSVTVFKGAHRDLVDVMDVVAIVTELLADAPKREDASKAEDASRGETVNIGSGHPVPAEDIIDHLIGRAGHPVTKQYRDRPDSCPVSLARLSRRAPITARLGFSPLYYQTVVDRYR